MGVIFFERMPVRLRCTALLVLPTVLGATRLEAQQMGTAQPEVVRPVVPPVRPLDDIKFLSDDRLGGRLTGSPGADTAAAYLARRFAAGSSRPREAGFRRSRSRGTRRWPSTPTRPGSRAAT